MYSIPVQVLPHLPFITLDIAGNLKIEYRHAYFDQLFVPDLVVWLFWKHSYVMMPFPPFVAALATLDLN